MMSSIIEHSLIIKKTNISLDQLLFHNLEDLHSHNLLKKIRTVKTISKTRSSEHEWEIKRHMELVPFFFLTLPARFFTIKENGFLDTTNPQRHHYRFTILPQEIDLLYQVDGTFLFIFEEDNKKVTIHIHLDCEIKNRHLFFREKIQEKLVKAILQLYISIFQTIEKEFSSIE